MRRILNTALEAQVLPPVSMISLEEEQIMLDEAASNQAEVAQDLSEAERIIEVSDALEDLAVVADGIEEATPAEAALVEVAGDMAVAGSDVTPEEIVPAMESYIGRRIATETIRETAASIWKSIQDFLKKIWTKIQDFFYKIFGTIPALRRRLKDLEKRADETHGKSLGETKSVKLSTGLNALSIDGKVVKNASDIASGVKTLSESVTYVFSTYIDNTVKRGEMIAKSIESFDPANAAKVAEDLVAELKGTKSGPVPGHGSDDFKRFPGFATQIGTPMFGNVSLASKNFKEGENQTDLGRLDRYRRGGVELLATSDKAITLPSDAEVAALSPTEVGNLIGEIDKILTKMEEYQRGAKAKAIQKTRGDLEAASKKATAAFEKAEKSEDVGEKAALPYYKALLNFNASFTRWAQTPAMPLVSQGITSIKAVMMVCEKSLALYK